MSAETPEGFEKILSDTANRFSNAAEEQFDEAVTKSLSELGGFLDFDRATVMAFCRPGCRFRVTHCWVDDRLPPSANVADVDVELPWFTHQIRSGNIVRVSTETDLPLAASQELAYLKKSGLKSSIAIPLVIEDAVVGALAFGAFRAEKPLPWAMVPRFRLVAEVLALGIRCHEYAQGLKTLVEGADQLLLRPERLDRTQQEHMRKMAVHLIERQQEECLRMGGMVHEDVMQLLASIGMLIQQAKERNPKKRSAAIAGTQELLRKAIKKLRQLAVALRPGTLSKTGIVDGIRWLADQERRMSALQIDLDVVGAIEPVNSDVQLFLYDAAMKLLENVSAHSGSNHARLELLRPDPGHVQLTVRDDGVGFRPPLRDEVPSGPNSLFSIAEHADLLGGQLEIHSAPGRGTAITATVPG